MKDENLLLAIIVTTATIFVLLAGTLGVLYVAYRSRLRQQSVLAAARISYEQELRTVAAEVSEQALSQLSFELHNNIGGHLTLLRIHLENFGLENPAEAVALAPASDALSETVTQVRLLSHSLSADMMQGAGLRAAILKESDRLRRNARTAVHFDAPDEEAASKLSSDAQLIAFRIFQEVVSNALKHARPKNIRIRLRESPVFELRVEDDGPGFDVEAARQRRTGAGLGSMEKRAEMAGLQCRIRAVLGEGTMMSLTRPADGATE